jgi:hypothetical protein
MFDIFCCPGLGNLSANAGKRGHAAIVFRKADGRLWMLLQSRGLAFEDETKISATDTEVIINVVTEVRIRYCPFCSTEIDVLTSAHAPLFEQLAEANFRYLSAAFAGINPR